MFIGNNVITNLNNVHNYFKITSLSVYVLAVH